MTKHTWAIVAVAATLAACSAGDTDKQPATAPADAVSGAITDAGTAQDAAPQGPDGAAPADSSGQRTPAGDAASGDGPPTDADVTSDTGLPVDTAPPKDSNATADTGQPAGLVVHEFLTFTAFHAANGHQYIGGVQRAEEQVPAFVHTRDVGPPQSGSKETTNAPILAKVQLAGAFFAAPSAMDIDFNIALPDGTVVADWPPAKTIAPQLLDNAKLAGGSAQWQLRVDPKGSEPTGPAGDVFGPLRKVVAATVAPVASPSERERFLFYRALGAFAPPLRVNATKSASIDNGYNVTVFNDGKDAVPLVFLLNLHSGGGLLQVANGVPAGGSALVSATPKESPASYFGQVKSVLALGLKQHGLSAAESEALVETFTQNWLKTMGLRLIVIAPPTWAQAWMPATITPTPTAHQRVLIGRIELLSTQDESALLAQVKAAATAKDLGVLSAFGFFAEPTARRMLALADSPALQQHCQALVDAAVKLK